MAMKRKPHQEGLDPQSPGIPITPQQLRQASKQYQQTQAKAASAAPVHQGSLAGMHVEEVPQNLTGVDGQAAPPPQAPQAPQQPPEPSAGGNGQGPEPSIPAAYSAGGPDDVADKHPLLADLEFNFGIEKLKCEHVMLGGYKWTFRPMAFEDYEWMANHARKNSMTQESSEPSMSVTGVAAVLAAVNDTPVYELFKVDTTGRHIPDPLNPPPDIKFEAAIYILEWFREKVGMWELIGKLDEQVDILFEEQRSSEFPLWATLASPYRQQIMELKRELDSSLTNDGDPGDDASQQQESSPQTQEPSSSGTTPEPPTSSSTGMTKQSEIGSTG